MLRIHQSKGGAKGAARYYAESLKKSDYYMEGLDIEGRWHGLALDKLGLAEGDAETAKQFSALLNNRHPVTGAKLTPRTNKDGNRTVGWDHVFSVPKSVSVAWALTGDPKIITAFRESVAETMAAIEARVETRVRIGGKNENRIAGGGIVWTEFLHTSTRPLSDGLPDPHLHIHAYLHNLVWDNVEDKFKAINLKSIKDNSYYFEALYDSILAKKLEEIGYPVERTAKGWELEALNDRGLIDKFSRRTLEIEKLAKELGITDPKEKEKLGAKTRNHKNKKLTPDELVEAWKSRLTPDEFSTIQSAYRRENPPSRKRVTAEEALDFSEGKHFQRDSVVVKERILASALKFGAGSVTLADLQAEMARRDYIERRVGNENKVTTPAQVVEEVLLVQKWREGQNKHSPLIKGKLNFIDERLSEHQRAAVSHILSSSDQIIALRGRAGTGKTTLLREVRTQLAQEGVRMIALAPSAAASRGVLRDDGFVGAETVARFLIDPELQKRARGHVLLIDEAGTIGNKDLTRLLSIAGESTRVILSGDTGQHSPQQRGDALRLLESVGLNAANVHHIIRQKETGYRQAVEAIADGNLSTAFAKLNEIGAIREYKHEGDRYRALALDYAQYLSETGVPPILLSPTHSEAKLMVGAVRDHLRELGKLGAERNYLQFRDLRLEDVEKLRSENYDAGQVVVPHQNLPGGIKRGSTLPVLGVDKANNVWIEAPTGKPMKLDLTRSNHFRVFQIEQIAFAPGDRIKLTNGGKDLNGRRIENGMLSTVKSIGKDGNLTLSNGIKLHGRFSHWAHGYDTSHSSQGKTAVDVLVAQSAMSSKAASIEQFYVTASRGEKRLQIYCDSSSKLMEAVAKSSHRMSALEFTGFDKEVIKTGGLSGKKWTERITSAKELQGKDIKAYLNKLLSERKPVMKDGEKENFFQNLLDMQRAGMGPDGKSRSKGQPHLNKAKRKEKLGSIDPRRSGLSESVTQEAKPDSKREAKPQKEITENKSAGKREAKAKGKKSAVIRQTEKAVKAGDKHLNEVVGRGKRGSETIKNGGNRSITFGKQETTLGKLANNPKTKAAQIKNQATQKPPTPKPPTPVIRRGR